MKRQRGRGRKPGGGHHHNHHQPNRTLESNGPDIKVRGPAAHIFERYLQLARDAASSGDRVLSENYMQHADHYFRLVRSMQPATPPQQQASDRFGDGSEGESDEDVGAEADAGEDEGAGAGEPGDQPDVEFPQGQQPAQFEREGGGEFRRRRGRRSRFRPEGEREGSAEGQGEERRERNEGEREGGRRERTREPEREQSGPEGFSNGPKPAFLRGGE
jgi:hypothetical protein